MKIYLSARFGQAEEMRNVRAELTKLGHTVTSRWIDGLLKENAEAARQDLEDIRQADAVLLFTDHTPSYEGGRHFETGYAYAAGKPIVIVGPRLNIFHYLPDIHCTSWLEDALVHLLCRPGSYYFEV